MASILALDPAWTEHEPSGVALITQWHGAWRCAGLAPSYSQFIALADRTLVDWTEVPVGVAPDVDALLRAATVLLGGQSVDLVTLDMPVSRQPILTRRFADNEVSRVFGARGCGTHSPTPTRPGAMGRSLSERFAALGYDVATTASSAGTVPALIEVYPHPALLTLLGEDYRVEYKINRMSRYFRDESSTPAERRQRIVDQWRRIYDHLACSMQAIDLPLPSHNDVATSTTRALKRYEDALDAVICAWVGIRFLEGRATPYGDDFAAIWIP